MMVTLLVAGCVLGGCGDGNTKQSTGATVIQRTGLRQTVSMEGNRAHVVVKYVEGSRPRTVALDVTAGRLVDPASNSQSPAAAGNRWVRIPVAVTNRGAEPYFLETAGFSLIDTRGRTFGRLITLAPWRQLVGRLEPRERVEASLGFQIGERSRLRELRFSAVTGAPAKARWLESRPR